MEGLEENIRLFYEEEISMTKLGEMLVEDGRKKGIQEGIKKNSLDTAIKAIEIGLDNDAIKKLTGLTEEEIEVLRMTKNN